MAGFGTTAEAIEIYCYTTTTMLKCQDEWSPRQPITKFNNLPLATTQASQKLTITATNYFDAKYNGS